MPSDDLWLVLTGETINLDALQQEIIDLFERCTCRLWDYRIDHEEVFFLENDNWDTLFLELWPINSITKIEEWDGVKYVEVEDDSSDYEIYRPNRVKRFDRPWKRRVKITYTGGYSSENLPEDVRRALLIQAKFMIDRNSAEKFILRSQSDQGGSTTYLAPDLHPYFRTIVKKRKRVA